MRAYTYTDLIADHAVAASGWRPSRSFPGIVEEGTGTNYGSSRVISNKPIVRDTSATWTPVTDKYGMTW